MNIKPLVDRKRQKTNPSRCVGGLFHSLNLGRPNQDNQDNAPSLQWIYNCMARRSGDLFTFDSLAYILHQNGSGTDLANCIQKQISCTCRQGYKGPPDYFPYEGLVHPTSPCRHGAAKKITVHFLCPFSNPTKIWANYYYCNS